MGSPIISFMHTCIGTARRTALTLGVTPCFYDKKKEIQMLFQRVLHETGLSPFTSILSDHMEQVFGYDVNCL